MLLSLKLATIIPGYCGKLFAKEIRTVHGINDKAIDVKLNFESKIVYLLL